MLLRNYNLNLLPEQTYNADEFGLVYKSMHDKTLVRFDKKSEQGIMQSNKRHYYNTLC